MAKVIINEEEFDTEDMNESAKKTLSSLQYVRNEVLRLQAQIAAFKTAEIAYAKALKENIIEDTDK